MKSKVAIAAMVIAMATVTSGCASLNEASRATPMALGPPGESSDLGQLIYLGAQTVAERAGILTRDRPIIVSTMVSIDDLNSSSTFGRLASQLIANRLAQRGYLVKDLTYMRALSVREGTGELVLSRDASRITSAVNAQAVVAGTYAVAGREIYLNIRLINAENGNILSTADVVIPLNHNTEALVSTGAPIAERLTVSERERVPYRAPRN